MRKIYYGYVYIILSLLFTLCSCDLEQGSYDSKDANQDTSAKKTYSRDEFKEKVMGLSGAFVIQELGTPDSTSESGGTEYWYYSQRSIDQVTGNLDSSVQLVFNSQDKLVSAINF